MLRTTTYDDTPGDADSPDANPTMSWDRLYTHTDAWSDAIRNCASYAVCLML